MSEKLANMRKLPGLILTVFLAYSVLLNGVDAWAQSLHAVWGSVCDAETGQALPGSVVEVMGGLKAAVTNEDGYFHILLPAGEYRLRVSHIGYRPDTLAVLVRDERVFLDVRLIPQPLVLPEVSITAYRYDAPERVLRRSIANLRRSLEQLEGKTFRAYNRLTVGFTHLVGKDSLQIGVIMETFTEGQWKGGRPTDEKIIAHKETGNLPPSLNLLTSLGVGGFLGDRVAIGDVQILSPLSKEALGKYRVQLVDTIPGADLRVIRLSFAPRSPFWPLLKGDLFVQDSTMGPLQLSGEPSEAVNLGQIDSAYVTLRFACLAESLWLPVQIELFQRMMEEIWFRQVSVFDTYDIGGQSALAGGLPFSKALAMREDSLRWDQLRPVPLTRDEVRAYAILDSLARHMPLFARAIVALASGGPSGDSEAEVSWTGIDDYLRYNRAEGLFLGAGTRWRPNEGLEIVARGGYAIAARRWEWEGSVARGLKDEGLFLKLRAYDRIRVVPLTVGPGITANTVQALLYKWDDYDYLFARGADLSVGYRDGAATQLTVCLRRERHELAKVKSHYALFGKDKDFRPALTIVPGRITTASTQVCLGRAEFLVSPYDTLLNRREPFVLTRVKAEVALRGGTSTRLRYRRIAVDLRCGGATLLDQPVDLWLAWRRVTEGGPAQAWFAVPGSHRSYTAWGAFHLLEIGQPRARELLLARFEQDLGTAPWRMLGIPLRLPLHVFANGVRFSRPRGYGGEETLWEAGVGVSQIFSVLRLDVAFRASGTLGRKWGISLVSGFPERQLFPF